MARGTWGVEIRNSGNVYVSDGTIYRPNDSFTVELASTQTVVPLANGANSYINPETKVTKLPLRLLFLEIDYTDSFRSKMENYVNNGDYVRITNHKSETFIGRFVGVRRVWISGTSPDVIDLEVDFFRME